MSDGKNQPRGIEDKHNTTLKLQSIEGNNYVDAVPVHKENMEVVLTKQNTFQTGAGFSTENQNS